MAVLWAIGAGLCAAMASVFGKLSVDNGTDRLVCGLLLGNCPKDDPFGSKASFESIF
jgi:hypothetical protein